MSLLDDTFLPSHLEYVDLLKLDSECTRQELVEKSKTRNRAKEVVLESHNLKDKPSTRVAARLESTGFKEEVTPNPHAVSIEYAYACRDLTSRERSLSLVACFLRNIA